MPEVVRPVAEPIADAVRSEHLAQPYHQKIDETLVDTYAYVTAQARIMEAHFRKPGGGGATGLITTRGAPRKGADFYLRLVNAQEKLARSLAIGPLSRAQMMQAAAGARKDHHEIEAARERMRAKLGLQAPISDA